MNKRRMAELIVFLLIMLGICVSVMFVDAFADKHDVDNSNVVIEETNFIIDQFDDEVEISQPPEDPQESEKIDAALDWHYIENVTLTAYCPCFSCCGEYSMNRPNGIVYTASGAEAQAYHTIAVDTDVIPLGAWVEIDGHTYHAEDVGGGVCGNHIDVYFDSHDDAVEFGRQMANVRWYGGLENEQ